MTFFKLAPNVTKYLGFFCKKCGHQDLSKIVKSGHTVPIIGKNVKFILWLNISFPTCYWYSAVSREVQAWWPDPRRTVPRWPLHWCTIPEHWWSAPWPPLGMRPLGRSEMTNWIYWLFSLVFYCLAFCQHSVSIVWRSLVDGNEPILKSPRCKLLYWHSTCTEKSKFVWLFGPSCCSPRNTKELTWSDMRAPKTRPIACRGSLISWGPKMMHKNLKVISIIVIIALKLVIPVPLIQLIGQWRYHSVYCCTYYHSIICFRASYIQGGEWKVWPASIYPFNGASGNTYSLVH